MLRTRPPQKQPAPNTRHSRSPHEESRSHPQPRGQEPSKERPPAPQPPHRARTKERQSDPVDQVVMREGGSDRRPKSSYTDRDTSSQSSKDKRPQSGPNIRTPHLPVTEGVVKTAQQTARPFNTYPCTDNNVWKGPNNQVHSQVIMKQERWMVRLLVDLLDVQRTLSDKRVSTLLMSSLYKHCVSSVLWRYPLQHCSRHPLLFLSYSTIPV